VTGGGRLRRHVRRPRRTTLGLRRRIFLIITIGAVALSLVLATTTYGLSRSNLLDQRQEVAISTSARNAQGVQRDLNRGQATSAAPAREGLASIGVQRYLIWYRGEWIGDPPLQQALPLSLREKVLEERESAWQIIRVGDQPNIVVGWDVPQGSACCWASSPPGGRCVRWERRHTPPRRSPAVGSTRASSRPMIPTCE
jgi:hypothetical protein